MVKMYTTTWNLSFQNHKNKWNIKKLTFLVQWPLYNDENDGWMLNLYNEWVHKILMDELDMRRMYAKTVSNILTQDQKMKSENVH